MLYISLLKTKTNQVAREHDTFEEAWTFLNELADKVKFDIVEGLILEESDDNYLDDQMPYFNSCKVIASIRTIR